MCGGAASEPQRARQRRDRHGQLQRCTSNDTEGYLLSVADTANRIKALKSAIRAIVIVAAITGPATPYTVNWKAPRAPTRRAARLPARGR